MRRGRLLKIAAAALVVWLLERAFEARERSASGGSTDHLASWPPPAAPSPDAPPSTAASAVDPQAGLFSGSPQLVEPGSAPGVAALDAPAPPPPPPPPPPPLATAAAATPAEAAGSVRAASSEATRPEPPAAAGPSVLKSLPCTDPVAAARTGGVRCTLVEVGTLTESLRGAGSSDDRRLGWGTSEEAAAPLVPLPAGVNIDALNTRRLTSSTVVVLKTGAASGSVVATAAAKRFAEQLAAATNGALRLTVCIEAECDAVTAPADKLILACESGEPAILPPLMQEAYKLVVPALASAQSSIRLSAPSAIGLVRGLATLSQLMAIRALEITSLGAAAGGAASSALIPVLEIDDRPAHSWRGLLIDVARHFIPMETVLKLLPLCAAVKINVLHMHLTDDQGWRYESTAHPELNAPASTGGSGKFYSQAEVKELVSTAHVHGIRVVPELNFPAHTDAAFIAFPWLGSKRISTINPKWGKHDTCAVPGDQTWALIDSILAELATLFPDEYVHIGGKNSWYATLRPGHADAAIA